MLVDCTFMSPYLSLPIPALQPARGTFNIDQISMEMAEPKRSFLGANLHQGALNNLQILPQQHI
jgi:hypothetical protein